MKLKPKKGVKNVFNPHFSRLLSLRKSVSSGDKISPHFLRLLRLQRMSLNQAIRYLITYELTGSTAHPSRHQRTALHHGSSSGSS